MGKRPGRSDEQWQEARRRCGLSAADVRMAKQLGMTPRSLIKNIPSKAQPWKTPVRLWVRDLHAKRFGTASSPAPAKPPPPAIPADETQWLDLEWLYALPTPTTPTTPTPRKKAGKATKPKPPAKPAPLGADAALIVPAVGSDEPLTVMYWDLWFSLVADADHNGDLARLAEHLADADGPGSLDRNSVRRKRAHLRDWARRLATAGRTIDDIVAAAGELARTELPRARRRVLESTEKPRDWSEAREKGPGTVVLCSDASTRSRSISE